MKVKFFSIILYFCIFFCIGRILGQEVSFERYPLNPVFVNGSVGSWNEAPQGDSWVIYDGIEYKMWYGASYNVNNGVRCIGLVSSTDGINWNHENNGEPVLSPGPSSWDSRIVDGPCVIYDEQTSTYHMWYWGCKGGAPPYCIGYATSSDGINWLKYEGNPVISAATPGTGSWDNPRFCAPSVLYDGKIFKMWYYGRGGWTYESAAIGYAESYDGGNWICYENNPIFRSSDVNNWSTIIMTPMVVFNEGKYLMWYTGRKADEYMKIGFAYSDDGLNWEAPEYDIALHDGEDGEWDDLGVMGPAVIWNVNLKAYQMWYGGIGSSNKFFDYGYALYQGFAFNSPPIADACPDQTVEATSPDGAEVLLDGSGSSDPDDDPLTYTWCENGNIIAGPTIEFQATVTLSLGEHMIELTVDDGKGGTDTDELIVNVVDTTPPDLSVSVTPNELWPPNHKMVDIVATVTMSDICDPDPAWTLVSIISNEPEEGPGKKHFPDIMDHEPGTPDVEFQLRAERLGGGEGRIYTITYRATDASDNSSITQDTVAVPHNMGKKLAGSFENIQPDSYNLQQNYPNPFNPETVINYVIPEKGYVILEVFNLTGNKVVTLVNDHMSTGYHSVKWNGRDSMGMLVPGGIYLCRIQVGAYQHTIRMLLIK